MKRTSRWILAGLMVALCGTAAGEPDLSDASSASALASARVPSAAIEVLAASRELTVVSLEASGQSAKLMLRGASRAAQCSVTISAQALRAAGIAAGSVLYLSAVTGGFILSAGGEVLAFLPDAISQSMIHRHRIAQ